MTNSFTNIFTGNPVQPAFISYKAFSITGNLQLNWPTQFLDTDNVVAEITEISVNADNYNVLLPDATLASIGQSIVFVNTSGAPHFFNILNFNNGFLASPTQGESLIIYLIDNSTQAGSWRIIPFGGGFSGVTSVAASALTAGITIGGSPITSAGTFTFSLSNSLVSLAGLASTGLITQSAVGTLVTRSIIGGTNIDATHGDGVLGNPVIDLSDTLTGISSIDVGSFNISNHSIITTGGNTNINIIPNGTGSTLIGPGLTPPTFSSTGNLSNINTLQVITSAAIADIGIISNTIVSTDVTGNLIVSAIGTGSLTLKGASNTNPLIVDHNNNLFHPAIPKAWVTFVGASGAISHSYNVTSVTRTGAGQYTVVIPGTLFATDLVPLPNCYGGNGFFINVQPTSLSTLTVSVRDNANTLADPTAVTLAIAGS